MDEWVAGSILGHHVCGTGKTAGIQPIMSSTQFSYHYDNTLDRPTLGMLRGQHVWEGMSHARPTYCNLCREALRGVTSHGLSCEVCKFKAHKSCASKAINNCKWTTLASVGREIIENEDGTLAMPHQWIEGNLPVSAKCYVCEKACGSVLRLQDWRCMWCRECVHTACRPSAPHVCKLGQAKVSLVPPTSLHSLGLSGDDTYEVIRPVGSSPLLVFVNSKSGDNQGVKFFKRFRQLLNPAQVFDLSVSGPSFGLKLFRAFDPFRILVCGGDGSVAWVLAEIDKLGMHKQCQVGILPLGTGNDLARVLGWGSSCDDDTHLPTLLSRYERGAPQMMDRWSIMTRESHMSQPIEDRKPSSVGFGAQAASGNSYYFPSSRNSSRSPSPIPGGAFGARDTSQERQAGRLSYASPHQYSANSMEFPQLSTLSAFLPIAAYEDSIIAHLSVILKAQDKRTQEEAVRALKETIKAFIIRVTEVEGQIFQPAHSTQSPVAGTSVHHLHPPGTMEPYPHNLPNTQTITKKCGVLQEYLDALLRALKTKRAVDTKAALFYQNQQNPATGSHNCHLLSDGTQGCQEADCSKRAEETGADMDDPFSPIDEGNLFVTGLSAAECEAMQLRDPMSLLEQESPSEQLNDDHSNRSPDDQGSSSGAEFSSSTHPPGSPRSPKEKSREDRRKESDPQEESIKNKDEMSCEQNEQSNQSEQEDNQARATSPQPGPSTSSNYLDKPSASSHRPSVGFKRKLDDFGSHLFAGKIKENCNPSLLYPKRNGSLSTDDYSEPIESDEDVEDEDEDDEEEDTKRQRMGPSKMATRRLTRAQNVCRQGTEEEEDEAFEKATLEATSAVKVRRKPRDTQGRMTKARMDALNRLKQEQLHVREVLIHRANALRAMVKTIIDIVDATLEEKAKKETSIGSTDGADSNPWASPAKEPTKSPAKAGFLTVPEAGFGGQQQEHMVKRGTGGLFHASDEIDCYEESKSLFGLQLQPPSTTGTEKQPSAASSAFRRTKLSPHGSLMDSFDILDPNPADIPEFPIAEEIIPLENPDPPGASKSPEAEAPDSRSHLALPEVKRTEPVRKPVEEAEALLFTSATTSNRPGPLISSLQFDSVEEEMVLPAITLSMPSPDENQDEDLEDGQDGANKMNCQSPALLTVPVFDSEIICNVYKSPKDLKAGSSPSQSGASSPYHRGKAPQNRAQTAARWLLHPRSFSFSHAPPPTSPGGSSAGGGGVGNGASSSSSYLKSLTTRRISQLAMPKIRRFRSPSAAVPSARDKARAASLAINLAESGKRKLPIINPLVQLPMWPNVSSHTGTGLISKVLLANADALCASALPLMGVDDFSMEGFDEKCTMNNYMGIGIDAKITLDFHMKREEHPEKCRSRTRNFMWYGMLGSKQMIQKTYKNLEQRVHLECDGQRIPLPSLQGIAILNIPSFMGGANFWGGNKSDAIFAAPSLDDKILEVVAVFGTTHMAASRIINLQRHRIAQCSSVKITIFGEGVPVEVDGEAWIQPPGVIRIVHKNRIQMLSRNRQLETSLKSWREKLLNKQVSTSTSITSASAKLTQPTPLSEEEKVILSALLENGLSLIRSVKLAAMDSPGGGLGEDLVSATNYASELMEKSFPQGRMHEGAALRITATEMVQAIRDLHELLNVYLRDRAASDAGISSVTESKLHSVCAHVEKELRKAQLPEDKDGFVQFATGVSIDGEDELEKKRGSKGFLRGLWNTRKSMANIMNVAGLRGSSEPQGAECAAAAVPDEHKPATKSVKEWNIDDVCSWLDQLDLSEHQETFKLHDIRGAELLQLDRRDLKELEIKKLGHVKRILQGIKDLKTQEKSSGRK